MEALATRTPVRASLALRSARVLRLASDERLVALTRAGAAAGFEAIYDRHHRHLLSFCRHMLGSREEAEDAVQHTFLSAHSALLASDRPIELRAWLYAIARNRCLSMLRARREHPTAATPDAPTAGLAEQAQDREDLRELLADLHALPDDQRAALVMAELGALGHDEIGEVLGVPREKVKALVFQARESLLASRRARQADCREIREQLATLTGGALRRAPLRRHLALCEGCRAYKAEIARQRKALAILLPVVPTAALKHGALPAGATSSGAAAAGALAGGSAGSAAKLAVVATLVATTTGGTVAFVHHRGRRPTAGRTPVATTAAPAHHARAAGATPAATVRVAATPAPPRHAARARRPHGPHTPAPERAARRTRIVTAPGRSATTPSRTGATPSRANPTPGQPARRQGPPATPPGRARAPQRRAAPAPPATSQGQGPHVTPPGAAHARGKP